MRKIFIVLLFLTIPAIAQISDLESCQQKACYGFRPPTGQSQNGMIFQDLSSTPPRLYCGYSQGWQLCGSSGNSIGAIPQAQIYVQPNAGTNASAGQCTTGLNCQAPQINSIKDASQYCTTSGTLDQSCISNALAAGATISLTPGTYNFNSTINVTQNNVTLTCTAGAVMYNNQSSSPAPMFNVTGNNFTISPGCTLDNGNVYMTYNTYPAIYGAGVITVNNQGNPQLSSPNFSGIIIKNCHTASCISSFNIKGGKFDQTTLDGNLFIHASGGTSQDFEVIGGSIGGLGVDILGGGGAIKNVNIVGTSLKANGGDSTCGGIGDYSGNVGSLSNISVTGTICTILNTSKSSITNAAVSGGIITLTLSAASQFFQGEQVTMSSVTAPFTCLNGQDLQVTATSGSTVSFAVGSTGCTGSSAVTGTALAAAFGGWSSPSYTMTSATFQGNTVQYAPGTSQYIQYAVLEMGCSNCSVKDNIINTPDAFNQNYSCITAYSGGMKIEGNLCNGFGSTGNGIGISAHTSQNLPIAANFSSIKNNTIINNVAAGSSSNLQAGAAINCNQPSGSTLFADVSGNKIYGAFYRGVAVTNTGAGTCTVSAKVEGNEIYNSYSGVMSYNSTVSLGGNMFSGVTFQYTDGGSNTQVPTTLVGPVQLQTVKNAASLGTDVNGNIVASSSNQVLIGSSAFNLSTTTAGCYRILTQNTQQAMSGWIDLLESGANGQELIITFNVGLYIPGVVTITGDVHSGSNGYITSVVASTSGAGSPINLDICAAAASGGVSYSAIKANFYGFGTPVGAIVASPVIGATAGTTTYSVAMPVNTSGLFSLTSNAMQMAQGFNALTGFQVNSAAPSGHVLIGNGTNYVDGTISAPLTGTTGSIGGSALTAGACASGTVSVASSTAGHPVSVSASDGTLHNPLVDLSASVTAAGTVTVQVCAISAVTPTAKTYTVSTY